MRKNKEKIILFLLVVIGTMVLLKTTAFAAPESVELPGVNIEVGGSGSIDDYVSNIKILIFFTILSLGPSIVILVTSFTRIVVVFSFLKNAMGTQQSIPNQVIIGLALFLTMFIMSPVISDMNENGIKPYMENQISQEEAIPKITQPLKDFMLKQTRQKDLQLFVEASNIEEEELTKENIPLRVVIPAFAISELKTAFQIGFLFFLPFLIIDMVVASVLMSMGMFMLSPTLISLPFKLLLFVMVDGWYLLVKSLILSFG